MRYPVYQAWLCLDSVILQRLDGVVFCCVMLLCMIQLVQSAAAVSSMLEMQGRRSEKMCRAFAALSAVSVLLFSSSFGSVLLLAAAAVITAAAVINAACAIVLRRKGSDEAKD
ncbi:MAG: hypothetical protein IJP01_05055 [Oscillospiraceae bacterium]|nr:hypothetical protein [Oscillospiraceae bacterium]